MPAIRHNRIHGHSPWDNTGRVDLRLEVPDWTKDALCAEIGVEAFFADGQGDHTVRDAKQACVGCPVRTNCLEWALTFAPWQDMYGVFGGTTPMERRAIRHSREQQEVAA